MSIECAIFCVGLVIQMASISAWYQFAIGRFIAGLGVGALSAAVPLYQAETGKPRFPFTVVGHILTALPVSCCCARTAPKAIRGTLTATYQLFITFGILLAYCFAIGTRELDEPPKRSSGSWRIVIGLGFVRGLPKKMS